MTTYFYRDGNGSTVSYTWPLPVEPMQHHNTAAYMNASSGQFTSTQPFNAARGWEWRPAAPMFVYYAPFSNLEEMASAGTSERNATEDGASSNHQAQGMVASSLDLSLVRWGVQSNGTVPMTRDSSRSQAYPDLDPIRRYHTMHSLLAWIEPARLQNAIYGPAIDIVEDRSAHVFARQVPKKMLVLFLGRHNVNKYLRTTEREDNDVWKSAPVTQELRLPYNYANHIGVKLVVAWMDRACRGRYEDRLRSIRVPKNLFAALSLSRALTTFRLHRDAAEVDSFIAAHHYRRPLYPDEIVSIWRCLPRDDRFVYRMIEDLRKNRAAHQVGSEAALPDAERVLEFLDENPELKARVDDENLNNSDCYRPSFGTEWCVRAANRTQQMMADMCIPSMQSSGHEIALLNQFARQHENQASDLGQTRRQFQAHDQPHKKNITMGNWKPNDPPAAWPKFEKGFVLKITEAKDSPEDPSKADSAHDHDNPKSQW